MPGRDHRRSAVTSISGSGRAEYAPQRTSKSMAQDRPLTVGPAARPPCRRDHSTVSLNYWGQLTVRRALRRWWRPPTQVPRKRHESIDDLQLLRPAAEVAAAVGLDADQVLDADPEAASDVDARLDRDDVALDELVLGGLSQPRRLVDLDSHAVSQAVAELVAVSGRRDHVAGHRVELLASNPGSYRREAGPLRLEHELVDLARAGVHVAGGERPGAVGAVALDDRPHVDHD